MEWIDIISLTLGIFSVIIGIVGLVLGGVVIHRVTVINKNITKIINEDNSLNCQFKKGINTGNQHAERDGRIINVNTDF